MNETDFADFMTIACTNHEAGFHFYDSGYVGMALALHENFERRGVESSLHLRLDVDHAYAFADDHFVDGQGRGAPEDQRGQFATRPTTREELSNLALSKGLTLDDIEADRLQASDIVASAIELHSDFIAATQTFRNRYGIDRFQAEELYWIIQEPPALRTLASIADGGFERRDFAQLRTEESLLLKLADAEGFMDDLSTMKEETAKYGAWVFFERVGKGEVFWATSHQFS